MVRTRKPQLNIQNVSEEMITGLKGISQKYNYPSLTQFMLAQLELIRQNEGLNIYQNLLAEDLEEIKRGQLACQEKIFELEILSIEILKYQSLIEDLSFHLLQFLDETKALEHRKDSL